MDYSKEVPWRRGAGGTPSHFYLQVYLAVAEFPFFVYYMPGNMLRFIIFIILIVVIIYFVLTRFVCAG
jgi:hypothetical protein